MDHPAFSMNSRNQQQLKSLYQVFRLAQNLNDTVRRLSSYEDSQLLWSTSFIQSQFACYMLADRNWHGLLDTGALEPWPAELSEGLSPTDKMKDMVRFCYDALGSETADIFDEILAKRLKNIRDPLTILCTRHSLVSTEVFQDNFQGRFQKIIDHDTKDLDEHMLLVYKLLRFIYSVRDNLFQGLAFISEPIDEFMPARFEIYSEILLASCELVFTTVEKISDWHHQDVTLFSTNVSMSQTLEESRLRNIGRSSIFTRK